MENANLSKWKHLARIYPFRQTFVKTQPGRLGKAGRGAQHSRPPHPQHGAGDPWGSAGLGLPAVSWCSGAFRHCRLPFGAWHAARLEKQRFFLSHPENWGKKGLKRDTTGLVAGASCLAARRGTPSTVGAWPVPKASPAPHSDEPVGGPAGKSPASAETPPAKDRLPALPAV